MIETDGNKKCPTRPTNPTKLLRATHPFLPEYLANLVLSMNIVSRTFPNPMGSGWVAKKAKSVPN
jgi:hypothetical protein